MRRTFLLAATGSVAFALLYACSSDSTNSPVTALDASGPNVDGSTGTPVVDSGTKPIDDAGTTPVDSGGGTPSDAGPLGSCTSSINVVGAKALSPISLAAFGDKYLVTWFDPTTQNLTGKWSGDPGKIDFGPALAQYVPTAVDSAGKEYILYPGGAGGALGRVIFDLPTGKILKSSPATSVTAGLNTYGVAALPNGALAVYGVSTKVLSVDESQNDKWDVDAGLDGGAYGTSTTISFGNAALNAAGKGAAWWVDSGGNGKSNLHVAAFDGTSLAAPVTRLFDASAGTPGSVWNAAALSNGDVAFTWSTFGAAFEVRFAVFHAATGTWDPDTILFTDPATVNPPEQATILIDSSDTTTVLWRFRGKPEMQVRRRVGTTFGDVISFAGTNTGASAYGVIGAMDKDGNVVAVPWDSVGKPSVTRLPRGATAFTPAVKTDLAGPTNDAPVLALDGTGNPIIARWGSPGPDISLTTCK